MKVILVILALTFSSTLWAESGKDAQKGILVADKIEFGKYLCGIKHHDEENKEMKTQCIDKFMDKKKYLDNPYAITLQVCGSNVDQPASMVIDCYDRAISKVGEYNWDKDLMELSSRCMYNSSGNIGRTFCLINGFDQANVHFYKTKGRSIYQGEGSTTK